MNPTPKQKRLLDFITSHIEKTGVNPSFQEMADAVGLRSLATIHKHLNGLTKRGLIQRVPGTKRSIQIPSSNRLILWRLRGNDFMAYFEHDPRLWAAGNTIAEAVGDLVMSHSAECGIAVGPEDRKAAA